MQLQRLREPLRPQPLQQPGRALHIGEKKRDRARRLRRHTPTIAPADTPDNDAADALVRIRPIRLDPASSGRSGGNGTCRRASPGAGACFDQATATPSSISRSGWRRTTPCRSDKCAQNEDLALEASNSLRLETEHRDDLSAGEFLLWVMR